MLSELLIDRGLRLAGDGYIIRAISRTHVASEDHERLPSARSASCRCAQSCGSSLGAL